MSWCWKKALNRGWVDACSMLFNFSASGIRYLWQQWRHRREKMCSLFLGDPSLVGRLVEKKRTGNTEAIWNKHLGLSAGGLAISSSCHTSLDLGFHSSLCRGQLSFDCVLHLHYDDGVLTIQTWHNSHRKDLTGIDPVIKALPASKRSSFPGLWTYNSLQESVPRCISSLQPNNCASIKNVLIHCLLSVFHDVRPRFPKWNNYRVQLT